MFTDARRCGEAQPGGVRIEIDALAAVPPSGEVVIDGAAARPFAGWLELLSILTEALPPARTETAPQGLGGQFDP